MSVNTSAVAAVRLYRPGEQAMHAELSLEHMDGQGYRVLQCQGHGGEHWECVHKNSQPLPLTEAQALFRHTLAARLNDGFVEVDSTQTDTGRSPPLFLQQHKIRPSDKEGVPGVEPELDGLSRAHEPAPLSCAASAEVPLPWAAIVRQFLLLVAVGVLTHSSLYLLGAAALSIWSIHHRRTTLTGLLLTAFLCLVLKIVLL